MDPADLTPGDLTFVAVMEGRYRLILLDQHKGIHEQGADTLEELNAWLTQQDGEIGVPILPDDLQGIQALLDVHGAIHVRSGMDVDMVFVKGGAPRG